MDPASDPPKLEIAGQSILVRRDSTGKYWTPVHPHRVFGSLQEMAEVMIAKQNK
jgi:hypothetical protein